MFRQNNIYKYQYGNQKYVFQYIVFFLHVAYHFLLPKIIFVDNNIIPITVRK